MVGFLIVLAFVLGWAVAHFQKGIKFEIVKKGLDPEEVGEGNPSYGDPRYMQWLDRNFAKGDE
jgi:hypothetical protein